MSKCLTWPVRPIPKIFDDIRAAGIARFRLAPPIGYQWVMLNLYFAISAAPIASGVVVVHYEPEQNPIAVSPQQMQIFRHRTDDVMSFPIIGGINVDHPAAATNPYMKGLAPVWVPNPDGILISIIALLASTTVLCRARVIEVPLDVDITPFLEGF